MMFSFSMIIAFFLHLCVTTSQRNCTEIIYHGNNSLLLNISGIYNEYYNCTIFEQGAYLPWFGNSDYSRCYKKNDGSSWEIWNTGCGWSIGNINCESEEECDWNRQILYYKDLCNQIPSNGLNEHALTTNILYDNFGIRINNLTSEFGLCDICYTTISYNGSNSLMLNNISGIYYQYDNCTRMENDVDKPWFGHGNFTTCFRKNDNSGLEIWNSGCGWTIGKVDCLFEEYCDWNRYVLYYISICDDITSDESDQHALSTNSLYDEFGEIIPGLKSHYHCI